MSEPVPIRQGAAAQAPAPRWRVRVAVNGDAPAVAGAVREMLFELGGAPPAIGELSKAAQALIDDSEAGVLLLAETDNELVGVLGMSWQIAVRIPGRYGLIQELWVRPAWRGKTVGGDLLAALYEVVREKGATRIEVGLPSERFPDLRATESFYHSNGFTPIGTRMRRLLA